MLYEFFITKKTQKTQMFFVRSQYTFKHREFLHKFNLKNSLQVFLRYDKRHLVTKT